MEEHKYKMRRKKQKQRRLICLIVIFTIVLIIAIICVVGALHRKPHSASGDVGGQAQTNSADASNIDANTPDESESDNSKKEDPAKNDSTDQEKENEPVSLQNEQITAIEALDSESHGWGQGNNVDENNRPVDAVSNQEKFSKYHADFIGPQDKKTIYLTFDEGYEYGLTEQFLNELKEKNAKAVFFVTKSYAQKEPEMVQRILDDGHILGNHSVTHPLDGLPSQTLEQQKAEVMDNHNYIKENFGYNMYLFRFPVGLYSEQSLAIVNNCNYHSVFWSFAYLDYDVNNQPDATESYNKLVSKLHSGAIYLLHPESQTNADILGRFIDEARAEGYTIGDYNDLL